MVILQNWCQQANDKRFFQMRRDLLLITSKRLHAGAFQIPKRDASFMPMRSFTCNLAIEMPKLALTGLATSWSAIMTKFKVTGPLPWQQYEEVPWIQVLLTIGLSYCKPLSQHVQLTRIASSAWMKRAAFLTSAPIKLVILVQQTPFNRWHWEMRSGTQLPWFQSSQPVERCSHQQSSPKGQFWRVNQHGKTHSMPCESH